MYQVLAVSVDIFHWVWIGALVAMIILSATSKFPLFKKIYLIMFGTTIFSQIVFLGCPLATLSQALRQHDDPHFSYGGGFTGFMLNKYLGINPPAIIGMIVIVILAALAIFILIACYGGKISFLRKKLPSFFAN